MCSCTNNPLISKIKKKKKRKEKKRKEEKTKEKGKDMNAQNTPSLLAFASFATFLPIRKRQS